MMIRLAQCNSSARTVAHISILLGASLATSGMTPQPSDSKQADLRALEGEWIFVEDRTVGRTLEQLSPPMGDKFIFKTEADAIILVWGHGGGGNRDVRIKLDGTPTEIPGTTAGALTRYRASWKDGALTYEMEFIRAAGSAPATLVKREFRMTQDGLIVRSNLGTGSELGPSALYRHPADIPMPAPFKAVIADIAWLSGPWVGSRSSGATFEERWSPPKGGAMLAISRTVNAAGKMSAFEFLRIVERDGGLVYVAQPGGAPATEFVLTELSKTRAVFDNPRHDYPKRIIYELSADGSLTAIIGYMKGGTPRRFEFKREMLK
ncbi:MAG: hypothetical protein IT363_16115 [Methanoregulaceae archaeon]|nr:hypothetical protein [Methanoregulaceae archaeon]